MKIHLKYASLALLLSGSAAAADPSFSLGVTFNFGGGQSGPVGITAGVWTDNRPDTGVAGVTGTWYPQTNAFGAGVGVGYLFDDGIGFLGYDFVQRNGQFGLGFASTDRDDDDKKKKGGGGGGGGDGEPTPEEPDFELTAF